MPTYPEILSAFNNSMTISNQNNSNSELIYINAMLNKTLQNHNLALVLFNKLFLELPEQIEQIETTLAAQEWGQAREIVHKLHGSVSFCGFAELQALSNNLETSLLANNVSEANQCFLRLKQNLVTLQSLQDKILQHFEKSA